MAVKSFVTAAAVCVTTLTALTGCGSPDATPDAGQKAETKGASAAPTSGSQPAGSNKPAAGRKVVTQQPEETPAAPFKPADVPAASGQGSPFPYLSEQVAEPVKMTANTVADAKDLPMWSGDRMVKVSGQVHQRAYLAGSGGAAAQAAALGHVTQFAQSVGAKKLTHSRLSDQAADQLNSFPELDKFSLGYGDAFNQPLTTYVVNVSGKQVWIQVCSNNIQTSVLLVSGAASS